MRRELSATIGEREILIAVEVGGDGRWRVDVAGEAREVDAVEISPGTWSLLIDGRSITIDVDRLGDQATLQVDGEEVVLELADARKKRLAQAMGQGARGATRGELVRAPIAGKVVKVLVEKGQEVAAGQGVAVLEAMKMENEIKADRGGTVDVVHVTAGQSVDTRSPLVTLR